MSVTNAVFILNDKIVNVQNEGSVSYCCILAVVVPVAADPDHSKRGTSASDSRVSRGTSAYHRLTCSGLQWQLLSTGDVFVDPIGPNDHLAAQAASHLLQANIYRQHKGSSTRFALPL